MTGTGTPDDRLKDVIVGAGRVSLRDEESAVLAKSARLLQATYVQAGSLI